jgi:predicted ATP-grasp superfamily ATP-dependent carboligase
LATAAAGGTIAAARGLNREGVEVAIVYSGRFEAAAWSRYVARAYWAPSEKNTQKFLQRLITVGQEAPGQVLLPTSDETAWLYGTHAAELGRYFRMYSAPAEILDRALDKSHFAQAAKAAGLDVPPSWYPVDLNDVAHLANTLNYPVLIKPRTHVHRLRNDKGAVVRTAQELLSEYKLIIEREGGGASEKPLPSHSWPILQKFLSVGSEGVLSITGFIDRAGEFFVARTSRKIFQRSQPVGVGVCFESLPQDIALTEAVRALCKRLGYFGIFEVEFIRSEGNWYVIDFNPRLFNQLGMDIRRGMNTPLFAYLDAVDNRALLRERITRAQVENTEKIVFFDRFTLRSILLAQRLSGRISRHDLGKWRAWLKENDYNGIDFAEDASDPVPAVFHAMNEIYLGLKALPRFLRSTPRVSSTAGSDLMKRRS